MFTLMMSLKDDWMMNDRVYPFYRSRMEFIQLSEYLSAYHIRGFEKYSSVHHVPGTVLDSGDTKMNRWGLGE